MIAAIIKKDRFDIKGIPSNWQPGKSLASAPTVKRVFSLDEFFDHMHARRQRVAKLTVTKNGEEVTVTLTVAGESVYSQKYDCNNRAQRRAAITALADYAKRNRLKTVVDRC